MAPLPLGGHQTRPPAAARNASSASTTAWTPGARFPRTWTAPGHSYGSLTTGLALQRGIDFADAVLFGSPGVGTDHVDHLGLRPGRVYVVEARHGPIADLASFGIDPNQLDGVTGLSAAREIVDGVERAESVGHSAYLADDTTSQCSIDAVVAGTPQHALHDDARPRRRARDARAVGAVTRLAPALLVLLLMTGCAGEGDPVSDKQSQNAALQERPTLEQEQERLTAVRDEVRDALSSRLGLTAWSERDEGNAAGCADYPDSDGYTAFLPLLVLSGGVPDDRWAQAVTVVEQVAAEAGFGLAETVVARPGQHEVVLRGERESLLRFGSMEDATMHLETGCHLPERAHS